MVSGIFLLENTEKDDFEIVTESLKKLLSNETVETIAIMAIWIKHFYKNERIDKNIYEEVTLIRNKKEAGSMLVQTLKELKEDHLAQGMQKQAVEVAKKMLEKKYPFKDVMYITGLSKEEVRKLL